MSDCKKMVKRSKSSRSKEIEENEDDEDDSERRKQTGSNAHEVNENDRDKDNDRKFEYTSVNSHPLSLNNDNEDIERCDERFKVYGIANNVMCVEKEKSEMIRDGKRLSDDNGNSQCCKRRTMRKKQACPTECEYWKGSLASEVRNSYWHCAEVENYPSEHNKDRESSPTGNMNVNRKEIPGGNAYCKRSDCIYLPFENVSQKSCFRNNCECQKFVFQKAKVNGSSVRNKREILLSPSTLPRLNKNYKACFCRTSDSCGDDFNKSGNISTPVYHSTYRRTAKKTCGNKEKKKSNHFKDKVNQVLPDVMASVVMSKHTLPESQIKMTQRETRFENGVNETSCDNCNQYKNVISHVPEPILTDDNSLVPKSSVVPENSVPFLPVHNVSSSSNCLQSFSNHSEKSDSVGLDEIKVSQVENDRKNVEETKWDSISFKDMSSKEHPTLETTETFLRIEIKLNQNDLEDTGGSGRKTCITESKTDTKTPNKACKDFEKGSERVYMEDNTCGTRHRGVILEANKLLSEHVPTSSKYLTSPFRNTRKKPRDQRPKSVPERKVRKQFYTPYEEALSSLLWQPYDCRNNALANMEWSDSEDQNERIMHRTRRKSGTRSSKLDRQEQRLVGSSNMQSYVLSGAFENPPHYGEVGSFTSIDMNHFFNGFDTNLLCRNCKINLFVEDDDEFRGQFFCFNCKELKRFLSENSAMTNDDILQHMNFGNKSSYGSLDGACGGTVSHNTDFSSSGSIQPNQSVPNFHFQNQSRTKSFLKIKHANELATLGKKPRQNQDNDTCSSTLSSSYSSTSSLSSLDLPPLGATPFMSSAPERSGSGTQPAQFNSVPCRVNVDQAQLRVFCSDTFVLSQTENLKPGYTNNVDSKMLVNISNSNHNLSLSQSNLLSNSSNNLNNSISVVTNNPSSNSCDNISCETNVVNIVSCYRAVPVKTSPSVPPTREINQITQHTLNDNTTNPIFNSHLGISGGGSSHAKSANRCVSNVSVNTCGLPPPPNGLAKTLPTTSGSGSRTFISTEAQTDEIILNRDQRRRERRERRQQRRLAQQLQQWPSVSIPPEPYPQDRLPDILHSHVPPPYSTLPVGVVPCSTSLPPSLSSPPSLLHPSLPNIPPSSHCGSPLHQPPIHPSPGVTSFAGIRFPFTIVPTGRRRSRLSRRGSGYTPEEEPKTCCGVSMTIRWFISIILVIGVLCVIIGCVLGTMNTGVRQHVSVSLLMIGVGIILVTVSGLAWRLSVYRDDVTPTWRMLLGLGGGHNTGEEGSGEPNRRFVPRLPPSYGRPHHPYAAMMYPEFQFRPPPPSYQASMQEYRLRLLLLDRQATPPNTVSPPPTYRSHSGSLLRAPPLSSIPSGGCQTLPRAHHFPPTPTPSLAPSHYTSRPPSYRSRPPSLHPGGPPSICHSRDSSDLSDSRGNVISVINTDGMLKLMEPQPDPTEAILKMMETATETLEHSDNGTQEKRDLVTVVSSPSTQVIVESVPLGLEEDTSQNAPTASSGEMHILAHL